MRTEKRKDAKVEREGQTVHGPPDLTDTLFEEESAFLSTQLNYSLEEGLVVGLELPAPITIRIPIPNPGKRWNHPLLTHPQSQSCLSKVCMIRCLRIKLQHHPKVQASQTHCHSFMGKPLTRTQTDFILEP